MKWLRQSTTANIKVGPFLSASDGTTAETILAPTVKLAKNGGALAVRSSTTVINHDADGYYNIELNEDDTGAVGLLKVISTEPGILPVWDDFLVLSPKVYDSLVTGNDNLDVSLVSSGMDMIRVESGLNARQALVAILAASAGVLNGAGSGTVTIRGGNTSTPRITATTDAAGNRTSVVLTLPS